MRNSSNRQRDEVTGTKRDAANSQCDAILLTSKKKNQAENTRKWCVQVRARVHKPAYSLVVYSNPFSTARDIRNSMLLGAVRYVSTQVIRNRLHEVQLYARVPKLITQQRARRLA
ncbi:hypothetical protein TNCV_2000391 [Trichonephila clavipes]|nr:hypothetical protein TNCV_2000391 [Trichonephila clavipes]